MQAICNPELRRVFSALNNEVDYIILRGYLPLSEIDESKDIDVFVKKEDLPKVDIILKKNGWKTPKYNCFKHPHKMYYYSMGVNNRVAIDVVSGVFYGKNILRLKNQEAVFSETFRLDVINVTHPSNALVLFLLHIVYDKQLLSGANRTRLFNLLREYESAGPCKCPVIHADLFWDYMLPSAYELVQSKSKDIDEKCFKVIREGASKYHILKANLLLRVIITIKRRYNHILYKIKGNEYE
jgi:hypothetical protein